MICCLCLLLSHHTPCTQGGWHEDADALPGVNVRSDKGRYARTCVLVLAMLAGIVKKDPHLFMMKVRRGIGSGTLTFGELAALVHALVRLPACCAAGLCLLCVVCACCVRMTHDDRPPGPAGDSSQPGPTGRLIACLTHARTYNTHTHALTTHTHTHAHTEQAIHPVTEATARAILAMNVTQALDG